MKLNDFLEFDGFQVIFPDYQEEQVKNFAGYMSKSLGQDVKLMRKPSIDSKKRNLKKKDILYLELKNSKKGIFGLLLCLHIFEELIEIRCVKQLHKFDIPKEIRKLNDKFDEHFENLFHNTNIKKTIDKLKLKDIDPDLLLNIKNLIKNKEREK